MLRKFNIIDAFFVLVLVALTIAFYRVLFPFIIDIFLAIILAMVFWKMFQMWTKLFRGRKGPASALSVAIILCVIGGVLVFLITVITREMSGGVANLREQWPELMVSLKGVRIPDILLRIPFINEIAEEGNISDLTRLLERLVSISSQFLLELVQKSFASITGTVVHMVFTLFILYFMFIDGHKLLKRVKSLIPFSDRDTDALTRELSVTTRATIISTVIIGLIEGSYGGVIFAVFRVPSPVLWSVIIFFISIVPVVGANVVLVPTGIIKIVTGHYISGIIIILLGIAGIAVTQNVIKPKLLGGRAGLHPMIVLLSTLGGIAWLGVVGFLVGPIIAALFIVIWRQFGERFKTDLADKNREDES